MARLRTDQQNSQRKKRGPDPQGEADAGRSWRAARLYTLARGLARPALPVAALAITILALLPTADVPRGFSAPAALNHVAAFTLLAFLIKTGWPGLWPSQIALGLIAYGIAIELIQPFFGRNDMVMDVVYDAIGIALGLLAAWVFARVFGPERAAR